MKYENRFQPLAPINVYYGRIMRNVGIASMVLLVSLLIGVLGYHYIGEIIWIDAVHNASMILSGMGPVADVKTFGGKIFSSAYAIFCGVVFITNIGFILAPAVHRLFHRLHIEDKETNR